MESLVQYSKTPPVVHILPLAQSHHVPSSLPESQNQPTAIMNLAAPGNISLPQLLEFDTLSAGYPATQVSFDSEAINRRTEISESRNWGNIDWAMPHIPILPTMPYFIDGASHSQRDNMPRLAYTDVGTLLRISHEGGDAKMVRQIATHLGPYIAESQSEQIIDIASGLTNQTAAAPVQAWTSLVTMILANHLAEPSAVKEFITQVDEDTLHTYLRFLLCGASPLKTAAAKYILVAAAACGDATLLQQGLRHGAAADIRSSKTWHQKSVTLLQTTLTCGHVEAAQLLLENGADVNISHMEKNIQRFSECDEQGFHAEELQCTCQWTGPCSPLSIAARSRKCAALIPNLLERGAKLPNAPLLIWAIMANAPLDILRCLIQAGCDVNFCTNSSTIFDHEATHALAAAAIRCKPEVVRLLLEEGARPDGVLGQRVSRPSKNDEIRWCSFAVTFRSPLCWAGNTFERDDWKNVLAITDLLLDHRADPNASAFDLCDDRAQSISFDERLKYEEVDGGDGDDDDDDDRGDDRYDNGIMEYHQDYAFYPIEAAVLFGHTALLHRLLDNGASLQPTYGRCILTLAVQTSHLDILKILLKRGAPPDGSGSRNYRSSPLVAAILRKNDEMIDLLLNAGANVNPSADRTGGLTPLQAAAKVNSIALFQRLIKAGASLIEDGGDYHRSILKSLVEHGHGNLLKKALTIETRRKDKRNGVSSALFTAVLRNDPAMIQRLLRCGADLHSYAYPPPETPYLPVLGEFLGICRTESFLLSPIQLAAALGHLETVKYLYKKGAKIDQRASTENGMMALHLAVCMDKLTLVKFLLNDGMAVSAISETKFESRFYKGSTAAAKTSLTPLGAAVVSGSVGMADLLLRNDADPNDHIRIGQGPRQGTFRLLDYVVRYHSGNLKLIKALLRAGADFGSGTALKSIVNSINPAENLELIKLLRCWDSSLTYRSGDDNILLLLAIYCGHIDWALELLESGIPVNGRSEYFEGCTALQIAATTGEVNLVERLLTTGANTNPPTLSKQGLPMVSQPSVGMGSLERALLSLFRGDDFNGPPYSRHGTTALQAAASRGYMRIAEALLNYGADICAPAEGEGGYTAIQRAAQHGRFSMVKLLLDRYNGPRFFKLQAEAYEAAQKHEQWHLIDLLETYEKPSDMSF